MRMRWIHGRRSLSLVFDRTCPTLSIVLSIALASLSGCAGSAKKTDPTALTVSLSEARSVSVLDGRTGEKIGWDQFAVAASQADAVIIGENHGHPLGLSASAALWDDVLSRTQHAAMGLEFFERDEQSRLDDYLSGVSDEATLRKRTERTASNYPPGHRAMVEAAKAHHRPVIAANAPHQYVRLARLEGCDRLAALSPEQRRLFRIPDELPGAESRYRKDFDKVMSEDAGHSGNGNAKSADPERQSRLDAAFRSQSMWDWTMAESVAREIDAGDVPMLQVVGRFHIDFGGGLVQALRKLRPGARIVTVSFVDEPAGPLRDDDRGRADYIVYVGESKPQ